MGYHEETYLEIHWVTCSYCQKQGHDEAHCLDLNPKLKPKWCRIWEDKQKVYACSDSKSESESPRKHKYSRYNFDYVNSYSDFSDSIKNAIHCTFFLPR